MKDMTAPTPSESHQLPRQLHAASQALAGSVRIPGDKSISHRALMLGAIAIGPTQITGLLEGDDVLATARALTALGTKIERIQPGQWCVQGQGLGNFSSPDQLLDFGNAGTGCRLMMGLMTASPCSAEFTGDASLSRRPMRRVLTPLCDMGLHVAPHDQDHLPLRLSGPEHPLPIDYALPVASAQVKSAILLAALGAAGETHIIEPHPTRDHTERMLKLFGADLNSELRDDGNHLWLRGQNQLRGQNISVPGDPSSAAFPLIAALMVPGSTVTLEGVMQNPHRDGLFRVITQMGAQLSYVNARDAAGEKVSDIQVTSHALSAITLEAAIAPSMIDEYPALAMLAACARGTSVFHGLGELRVKESDRLSAIIDGLQANGVAARCEGDSLIIDGVDMAGGGVIAGGGTVNTHHDHRIAMSFLSLGLVSQKPVRVDDAQMIATSFPNFFTLMQSLGVSYEDPAHQAEQSTDHAGRR